MDITSVWEYFTGQNPMFMAATGSVALGVTLILAAGTVQMKRLRARAGKAPAAEIAVPAPPALEIEETTIQDPEPASNPEMQHLLARLRIAADKLENFRASNAADTPARQDSPLKSAHSGVDYIFRAGTG